MANPAHLITQKMDKGGTSVYTTGRPNGGEIMAYAAVQSIVSNGEARLETPPDGPAILTISRPLRGKIPDGLEIRTLGNRRQERAGRFHRGGPNHQTCGHCAGLPSNGRTK